MMSLAAFRKRFVNYVKYLFLHHDHLTARRRSRSPDLLLDATTHIARSTPHPLAPILNN